MVVPEKVTDADMVLMARDIAKRIEAVIVIGKQFDGYAPVRGKLVIVNRIDEHPVRSPESPEPEIAYGIGIPFV